MTRNALIASLLLANQTTTIWTTNFCFGFNAVNLPVSHPSSICLWRCSIAYTTQSWYCKVHRVLIQVVESKYSRKACAQSRVGEMFTNASRSRSAWTFFCCIAFTTRRWEKASGVATSSGAHLLPLFTRLVARVGELCTKTTRWWYSSTKHVIRADFYNNIFTTATACLLQLTSPNYKYFKSINVIRTAVMRWRILNAVKTNLSSVCAQWCVTHSEHHWIKSVYLSRRKVLWQ